MSEDSKANGNQLAHSFNSVGDCEGNFYGLTKREYLVAEIVNGYISSYSGLSDVKFRDEDAVMCVEIADKVLKALSNN